MRKIFFLLFLIFGASLAWLDSHTNFLQGVSEDTTMDVLNRVAESYVQLVLALGEHDPDYVDAYYGPEAWRETAKAAERSLSGIRRTGTSLLVDLKTVDPSSWEEMVQLRHQYLSRQIQSLIARIDMLQGKRFTFDEETRALYDAVAPVYPRSHYEDLLGRIAARLPGEGSVGSRYLQFRKDFIIPPERLDAVFQRALEEGRKRTKRHIELPENESFQLEYVTGKAWSGYNWYQGNAHSLIQMNTSLPIYIDRALDLACHEGYPGHHVYNVLLEKELAKDRGWVEFTVYPLFSPQSLIAEGTANYGIDVTFPFEDRIAFEKDVLFPLAGLDPENTNLYYEVMELVDELSYSENEAARGYLNGTMTKEEAIRWLETYSLFTSERARQRIAFMDKYRSYVINYNYGKDLVRNYIESRGGTASHPEKRWKEFEELLGSPRLPSGLQ